MEKCISFCTARHYAFNELTLYLQDRYKCVAHRDVLHVRKDKGDLFVFQYGVTVFWGLSYDDQASLLASLKQFEAGSLDNNPIVDEFTFSYVATATRIHKDHIYLNKRSSKANRDLEKLAISHIVAQSAKLAQFEESAAKTIERTIHIPERMAKTGKTGLNRTDVARIRGELHRAKSQINLSFELLDSPEFFWDYPEYDPILQLFSNYLEIQARIEVLNKKIEVISDLFNMLANEQNHKDSSRLEWIIIWLIAIEILLFLINEIVKR